MGKNKVAKYLAYAVGEIILVVIGILIAVAINDRQKDKADKVELDRILERIAFDLEKDIVEIDTVLKILEESERIMNNMLSTSNYKDLIKNCFECKTIASGHEAADFSIKGKQLLNSYNKSIEGKETIINKIELFYNSHLPEIKINDDFMFEEIKEFVSYLRDEHYWFKEFAFDYNCNSDCDDYFSSQSYLNRIVLINAIISDSQIILLENYKEDALNLIENIRSN